MNKPLCHTTHASWNRILSVALLYYFLGLEYFLLTRSVEFFFDCRLCIGDKGETYNKRLGWANRVPVRRTTSASHCQLWFPSVLEMENFDVFPTGCIELVEKMFCKTVILLT